VLGKTKASSLGPVFAQFAKLEYLALTADPAIYVNPQLLDSAAMNAREDAKYNSPYHDDDLNVVARAFFEKCTLLKELCLGPEYEIEVFVPVRNATDTVTSVTHTGSFDETWNTVEKGLFDPNPRYHGNWPRMMEVTYR